MPGICARLLEGMVADDARAVDRLPLLSDAERHQLLVEWNATEADYPRDKCVHELFEAQAARTPDAIAVVHDDARLTYAELNARANRLAHHLRTLGVKPDVRVAIGLEHSLELVVAELAILKCGAAYVPLDQNAPIQRQTFMIEDCQAQIVLTAKGQDVPEIAGVKRVDVDELTPTEQDDAGGAGGQRRDGLRHVHFWFYGSTQRCHGSASSGGTAGAEQRLCELPSRRSRRLRRQSSI